MRKTLLVVTGVSLALLAAVVFAQDNKKACGMTEAATKPCCPMMAEVSAAAKAVDEAIAAVNAGQKDQALAALNQAKASMAKVQQCPMMKDGCPMMDKAMKGCPMKAAADAATKFANVKCPMMDSAINPAKVTPELTREFKGQKIAFCCKGCPAQWDKLSDEEKQAKLDAVKAPADAPSCTTGCR